eukprot:TRINITY_DN7873_c0_g1_i1.p2 TRINITY_DN7873_c0_g1~~TRINITY_DN7873_c0_g1_i1.p2  ORF type:complete len:113 (-),score=11.62 TRINITY_DN7873_c0_g1_i1:294-632(-)
MARCLAAAPAPTLDTRVKLDAQMRDAGGATSSTTPPKKHDSEAAMEVEGETRLLRRLRGPNQYKKQGLLKRGAKAKLGISKKASLKPKVKGHGMTLKKRVPRFSKSSGKRKK